MLGGDGKNDARTPEVWAGLGGAFGWHLDPPGAFSGLYYLGCFEGPCVFLWFVGCMFLGRGTFFLRCG